ncbi:hypothetical protein PZF67_006724 [Pseudomonas aeruginosa]|uniref:hypothetical protein n=1 Tax=Pseudomonas TaxID=286 RepID=UPI000708290A|nr:MULTISPECIES: hypothetical protein [Pseudomonas]EKW9641657.1 hypothetical protein [Pseudomonas aeruginosa]KQJ49939.1 hypothetical protein AN280_30900 [Pseudomonas aeruginosa]MBW5465832.1 hypothetical protein [Pseudomonas aeruginosa]SUF22550.1 Uncharacterised protein [Pseudomonas putida]HBO7046395.1 hypothetical protein [Pseudomonas aeruginosa]
MSHPLTRLASAPLAQAAPETLIEVALLVWYDLDPLPLLTRTLDTLQGAELRRALYVLDRLRRYGTALTKQRYQELTDLVRSPRWDHLKVIFVPPPPYPRGPLRVEILALEWGLEGENELLNTKTILYYQTRHYAAERRKGVD